MTHLEVGFVTRVTILSRLGWLFSQSKGQLHGAPEGHRWTNASRGSSAQQLVWCTLEHPKSKRGRPGWPGAE